MSVHIKILDEVIPPRPSSPSRTDEHDILSFRGPWPTTDDLHYGTISCTQVRVLSALISSQCTCATRTQNPSPRSDAVGNTANTTSTCPPRAIPQRQPSHAPYPRCGHGHSHGTGRSQTTNQDPGTHMGSCGSAAANDSCSTFLNLPHSTQLLRVRASRDINLSDS